MSMIGNIRSCQKGSSVGIGCGGLVRVATPHNLSHESIMRVNYTSTPFLEATACWFMWSVAVILIFFDVLKTFFPLLAFPGNVLYWTRLNSASSSWSSLICYFCSWIIPAYCVSTLTFHKGGAMSQSADTADADADGDVDVVLESICFSCLSTTVDEQCKVNVIEGVLIWKKLRVV